MPKFPSQPADVDPVFAGVQQEIERGIVTGYVLIAEWIDDEGDKRIYCSTMEDQRAHVTLGLLNFGDAIERARIVDSWREDD